MLTMFRWLALVSALVFVTAIAGMILSSQPPVEPAQQQAAENNKKEHGKQESNKALWDSWFPDPLSVYTLFLVIFTGLLVVVGAYQWRALVRAERISASTAKAAQDSADVTRDAVKLSEKTAQQQLRAYIVISAMEKVTDPSFPNHVTVEINYINAGQTPAYEIELVANIDIREYPLKTGLPNVAAAKTATRILGPKIGNHTRIKTRVPLRPEDEAAIVAGNKAVYVWGRIDYRDIFEERRFIEFSSTSEGEGFSRGAFHEGPINEKAN
jgi:hypothetical protein